MYRINRWLLFTILAMLVFDVWLVLYGAPWAMRTIDAWLQK